MYRFHEGSAPQERKPEEVTPEADTSWVDLAEGNLYQENRVGAPAAETVATTAVESEVAGSLESEQILAEPVSANENFNSDWVNLAGGNVVQQPENILDREFSPEVTQSNELLKSVTDGTYGNKSFEMPSLEKIKESLSAMGAGAQEFFKGMSEKGKATASALYEGINKIPAVQRLTSKMGIAYNQFFIDRQEKGVIESKEQLSATENEIAKIQEDSAQLEMIISNLPKNGASGLSGMERMANKLDEQKIALLDKQLKLNDRISSGGQKMEAFTSKRDVIADKMIGVYAEKLGSVEGKIGKIEADKKLAEDDIEAANTIHELDLKQLDFQELQLKKAEAIYQSRGLPLGDIRRMEKQIADSREKIRKSQESLQDRLSKITEKIQKAQDRAKPFKERKKEFEGLKRSSGFIETPVTEDEGTAIENNEAEANDDATEQELNPELSIAENIKAAIERGEILEVKSMSGSSLDDWIITGSDGNEVFIKLKGAETIRKAVSIEEIQASNPEGIFKETVSNTTEATEQEADSESLENSEELPDIVRYLNEEKLIEDDDVRAVEVLTTLISEDSDIGNFLEDFYTGPYDDEKRASLVAEFTQRFAESDKVIFEDVESLTQKPLILTHPNTNQKIAITLSSNNHLNITMFKE